jgi:hypothetical protein
MPPWLRLLFGITAVAAVAKTVEDVMLANRKVFVSFDWENDRRYKHLLEAWHANREFQFRFNDASSGEIDSNDIGRVKAALTSKIREADLTLVIVGAEANTPHRQRAAIGYRNWINFEIAKSIEAGNRIAAVRLESWYTAPEELARASVSWANGFSEAEVIRALRYA